MTFKHKLQLFLFPAILFPALIVILVNFIITGYNIRDMQNALLTERVKSAIEKCAAEQKILTSSGMDNVEFYQEATKKLAAAELQHNATTSGMLTIIETRTLALVFSTAPEEQRFFQTPQSIRRMIQQQHGTEAYRNVSQTGASFTQLTAFGVYDHWNWLVIAHIDARAAYQYLYNASALSFLIVGVCVTIFCAVIYQWSQRITRSLERLEQGTIHLAEHHFEVTVDISGNDEFGRLARSFNAMASEISQTQRELKIAVQQSEDAKHALEWSLQWNQAIIKAIPDLLFTLDLSGTFLDCHTNDSNRLFLFNDQFLGKQIADVMPANVAANTLNAIASALNTGALQTFEYDLDAPQGRFWFESRVMKLSSKTVLTMLRDITDRKQAEHALRESEERHRTIIQTAMDGFWQTDLQGRLLRVNAAYCRMSGYTEPELLSRNIADMEAVETPEHISAHIQMILARGEMRFETRHRHKHGSLYDVEVSALYRNGQIVAFLRDITERKRAEEQNREQNRRLEEAVQQKQRDMEELFERLLRQEKLATIGRIAGSIAHELRNPLGAVKNSVYYLKRIAQTSSFTLSHPKVLSHLELMNGELNISERVIADLLEMTRLKPAHCLKADFRAILFDALAHLHLPEQVRVSIALEHEPFIIYADPLQLRQVLLNVLTNAAQSIEETGTITIRARQRPEPQESEIEIHDSGGGVASEALSKIFEPLYTTKANGTGLGLSICKQILESHHGRITLASELGQGTTVTIVLPHIRVDEN